MPKTKFQLQQRVLAIPPQQLKALRDNPQLPYNVRKAAGNLLVAKQIDGVRQDHLR